MVLYIALFDDSQLLFGPKSDVTFLRNYAQQNGGGVLFHLSTMVVEQEARIDFTGKAYNVGALSLQNGARVVQKSRSQVTFVGNHAQQYGGALHIEEPAYNYLLNRHDVYRIKCFFEQLEP